MVLNEIFQRVDADGSGKISFMELCDAARAYDLTMDQNELRKLFQRFDNDGEEGGGWQHDLLNDSTYASLLSRAAAGEFDAIMVAFPCSTFSISRFFDAASSPTKLKVSRSRVHKVQSVAASTEAARGVL